MTDSMKIKVEAFTPASISEAMEEYGFDGECDFSEGARQGTFRVRGGTYRFICHQVSGEIEITELLIDVGGMA